MARETVVERGDGALMVMDLVSTERGTEVAIEIRDPERQKECTAPAPEQRAAAGQWDSVSLFGAVRLRDDRREYAIAPTGGSFSVGQHRFGFFGRGVVFAQLPSEARRVTFEVRGGSLGEWDVPIELAPIEETNVLPIYDSGTSLERNGITIRVTGVISAEEETVVALEASGARPGVMIRGFGAEFNRFIDAPLTLIDGRGERHTEIVTDTLPREHPSESGRALVAFPRLPLGAGSVTLIVPTMIVREAGPAVTLDLPINEPQDVTLGPYSLRVSSAQVGVEPRRPPTLTPERPAIVLVLAPGDLSGDRRALRPSRFLVDGTHRLHGWGRGAEPDVLTFHVPFPEGVQPMTITLADPIVQVGGPWELAFTVS